MVVWLSQISGFTQAVFSYTYTCICICLVCQNLTSHDSKIIAPSSTELGPRQIAVRCDFDDWVCPPRLRRLRIQKKHTPVNLTWRNCVQKLICILPFILILYVAFYMVCAWELVVFFCLLAFKCIILNRNIESSFINRYR